MVSNFQYTRPNTPSTLKGPHPAPNITLLFFIGLKLTEERIFDVSLYFDCITETAIVLDPNHQEDNPDHQASGRSTIITQLIKLNDSDSCDVLTNSIFVLLLLLVLGCLALIIAMCVDPKVIGVEIHEDQHILIEIALSHMKP